MPLVSWPGLKSICRLWPTDRGPPSVLQPDVIGTPLYMSNSASSRWSLADLLATALPRPHRTALEISFRTSAVFPLTGCLCCRRRTVLLGNPAGNNLASAEATGETWSTLSPTSSNASTYPPCHGRGAPHMLSGNFRTAVAWRIGGPPQYRTTGSRVAGAAVRTTVRSLRRAPPSPRIHLCSEDAPVNRAISSSGGI
jgi:hypothetical protein